MPLMSTTLSSVIDKNDMVFGRALHGLYFLIKQISCGAQRKLRVIVNPNICPEVLDLLERNVSVVYVDYDPQRDVFTDHVKNILLHSTDCPTIILYNCVYGDNQIDCDELQEIKKQFRNVTFVLDACLLASQHYTQYKYSNVFDAVLYSFGYSKYLDLNYGGVLSLSENIRSKVDFSQLPEANYDFFNRCMWETYPIESKSCLIFDQVIYHTFSNSQLDYLNRKLSKKEQKVIETRTSSRSQLKVLLRDYCDYLLPTDRFDWRLNYIIKDDIARKEFLTVLRSNGILYSQHYQHAPLPTTMKSNTVIETIINVLDDDRQVTI